MMLCRKVFNQKRQAAVIVQAHWRGLVARRHICELVRQQRAAVLIQASVRAHLQRQEFLAIARAAVVLQRAWRRCKVSR
jgi:hypothetical protein